jgi:glycosyltransferase involved in cell wall biosynthesis
MRVAYFSPLPPMRTGIADYSAELLPYLARHFEPELFVDDGFRPDPEAVGSFPVRGHRAFPALWEEGRYDAVVYQLGNNADFHARIYEMLLRYPGVVVLHESMLHHLIRGMTLARGDLAGYVEAMRYSYGRTGQSLARRSLDTGIPLDVWSYPLFERAVDASLGLIVHNRTTGDRVLAARPLARVACVPHHLSLGDTPDPDPQTVAEIRRSLGIPADAFVVSSFGFITPAKRIEVTLRAFARLRREVPHAVLYLVGEVSPHYDLSGLLTPEVAPGVVPVGRTDLEPFLRYMAATDVAVNLRYPSAGETSGTLIRLLGLGKPVIVSNTGSFAEIPDDACAKVDLDESEEELLVAYLRRLALDEPLRRRMGENARRHMRTHHTLEGAAEGYAAMVRRVVEEKPAPFRAVPPLAPAAPDDVFAELVAEVAAQAVDLGVDEREEDLLRDLAEIFVDLRLDGRLDGRTAG